MASPISQGKRDFLAWVDRIEREGHITHGNARHLKSKFNSLFTTVDANSFSTRKTVLFQWIDQAKKDSHFTEGNVKRIKDKVNSCFAALAAQVQTPRQITAPTSQIDTTRIQAVAQQKKYIHFYLHGLTACFGNFYNVPGKITYKGHSYDCVEAAFQAAKYPGHERSFVGLNGEQAFQQRNRLDQQGVQPITGWHSNKVDVMTALIRLKFSQQPFKAALLATGNAYLVEHNERFGRDTEWSDNTDGTGKNLLGQILMKVRGELGGTGVVGKAEEYLADLRKHQNAIPSIR